MLVPGPASNQDTPTSVELSPALGTQLLELSVWQNALQRYALATNLAVALTDAEGRLLGECLNPQPTWRLLHAKKPSSAGVCPFALLPLKPCTCVADALAMGGHRVARDRTGLVHFAVPLVLGEHALGALVAGQVFEQYPDQIALELVAKRLGVSFQELWQAARLENPINRRTTLRVYADLLATLADNVLRSRFHTLIEAERLAQMTQLGDQLQQRTQELSEANRRKDEFLAMLAHELRNPLAPIRNAAQVMRLLAQDDANLRCAGEVVERQVQHMSRLVDDLLDVARFSSGKITLQKEPTDLAAVVARAVETSRPAIEGRRHELSVTLTPERLRVEADPVRLAQVLDNLLNNAAKYTPEGGRIWLTAGREGREAAVRVRDTGIGIPANMLANVFDLFTQVDRTLDHSQGGLGIGLTLVRRLVELHGGSVQATSGGANQGSEFVIRLPLLLETERAPGTWEEENGLAARPRRRILVVDDNMDASQSLAKLLELTGHEARVAHDGATALDVAQVYRPDVVLLDIGLPQIDGYEVARRLREQPGTEHALLVALTGYGHEEDRRRTREAGFDHHLVKPVDPNAIQQLLALPEPTVQSSP
jgi:signal transduction histidine kinase/ActR/RegA family two-component response regulator